MLEVVRGRTSYRHRPVDSRWFTIGSARGCDLQLGGNRVPDCHSVVVGNDGGHWLEALADSPQLIINGEARQHVQLRDGDRIEIGEFEFVVCLSRSEAKRDTVESKRIGAGTRPAGVHDDAPQHREPADPASLSASELVDLIEAEEARVVQFESGRRLGAEALLRAARERAGRSAQPIDDHPAPLLLPIAAAQSPQNSRVAAMPPVDAAHSNAAASEFVLDSRLTEEIVELCERLSLTAARVKVQWPALIKYDPEFAEALSRVLDVQQRLTGRLAAIRSTAPGGHHPRRPTAGSDLAIA